MLTRTLIVINVIVFVFELVTGAASLGLGGSGGELRTLVAEGAYYGPLVAQGEWWRAITSAFLHGGVLHITFNMITLGVVGRAVELLFGAPRMALLYLIAIAGSSWAIQTFNYTVPTVGASGAIFGLFGALLGAGLRLGPRGAQLVRENIGIVVINLLIGFTVPGISIAAHIGGLLAGLVAGFVLFTVPPALQSPAQVVAERAAARDEDIIEGELEESPPR